MQEPAVESPCGHPATLLYLATYPSVRGKSLARLDLRKLNRDYPEKPYKKALTALVAEFLRELTGRPECPPDVVLVSPEPCVRRPS
jgi:hypothetical protein